MLTVLIGGAMAVPLLASPSGWVWTDQSGLLPMRDGVSLDTLSANAGSWLASDTQHLYEVSGNTLQDLTGTLHARGINTLMTIASDNQNWLVAGRGLDASAPRVYLTNGDTWNDISSIFSQARGGLDAVGSNGTWYGRTFTTATTYEPSRWTAFAFNPTTQTKNVLPIIPGLNNMQSGCFTEVTGVRQCLGATQIVHINDNWFLIGGNSEVVNPQGKTTQFAQGAIWKIDGTNVTQMTTLPGFRFVSGIWQGQNRVLVATSDVVSNPFSSDHFWMFDGTTLTDYSDEALKVGLLSNDAREVHAADAGKTWLITIGKNLIRFDGDTMTDQGKTRDYFTAVTSNGQGVFMLGGAVSTPDQSFASQPLTAKLVQVREDSTGLHTSNTEAFSRSRGPSLTIKAIPHDSIVGDGKIYTFRVIANDASGVTHTDIFVNGAKLKICPTNTCEYTNTYYTNGQASRVIEFQGSAANTQGYVSMSKITKLTIDRNSQASATNDQLGQTDAQGNVITLPATQSWQYDHKSGTHWVIWRAPVQTTLQDKDETTINVAVQNPAGLGRVNVVVNGVVTRSCDFTSVTDIRVCTVTLIGSDFPLSTEIFVNAQAFNSQNHDEQSVWTDGVRIQRAATKDTTIPTNTQTVQTAAIASPIFSTMLTIDPDTNTVKRGSTFVIHTRNQNSRAGLMKIDIYQNDKIVHTCSVGTVVGPIACDTKIDTTSIAAGTTLSYVVRAMDTRYQTIWSNTRSITIQDPNAQPQPMNANNGISAWSWMAPDVSELLQSQTTYSAGAWSANGIDHIDMIVDGQVRRTCVYGLSADNRDCSVVLSTDDYADKHAISVNARIVDGKGLVAWTDVRSILMRRYWQENDGGVYLPAFASVTANEIGGFDTNDRIIFNAKGWAPSGVDRTQIYLNGTLVANCPGSKCAFTSAPITGTQIEYQARVIDIFGQSTWTGLLGMSQK